MSEGPGGAAGAGAWGAAPEWGIGRLARPPSPGVRCGDARGLPPQARRHVPVDRATKARRNVADGPVGSGGRPGGWAAARLPPPGKGRVCVWGVCVAGGLPLSFPAGAGSCGGEEGGGRPRRRGGRALGGGQGRSPSRSSAGRAAESGAAPAAPGRW